MLDAVRRRIAGKDAIIMAAAVSDFRAKAAASAKIRKTGRASLALELSRTRDILETVAKLPDRPFVVAFAAETDDVERNAREKLRRKRADLIVANDVSDPSIGFDSAENEVTIYATDGSAIHLERDSKLRIAGRILDEVARRLGPGGES